MKIGIREIAFIVLLMAIPVGAWWFVFRPADLRDDEMMKQIESRQEKLQSLNRATATIGNLKTEINSLDEGIAFFRSKLPSEKEIDKVLREVWRLAEANKLTTKSIKTLKNSGKAVKLTNTSGPYAEQPIFIELEGSFTGFYGFLLSLEAQPRIMRLQQMSIQKDTKSGEGKIRALCTVSVFFEHSGKG